MIVQSFNFFDVNDDGMITKEELEQLLKLDNADLSDDVLEYIIQQVDTNNDGKVSFEEFVKMLQVGEEVGQISQGTSGQLLKYHERRTTEKRKRKSEKNDESVAGSPQKNEPPLIYSDVFNQFDEVMQVDMDQGQSEMRGGGADYGRQKVAPLNIH